MRAIFAAIARALRAALGIFWMPFEWAGSLFSGFGGGSASPQDDAAAVARRAANEAQTEELASAAEERITVDEAHTIKRVAGRLLAGKPIVPGTRVSPGMLEALNAFPRQLLKRIAGGDPEMVASIVDGYRGGRITETAKMNGIPAAEVQAAFPNLTARLAARTSRAANDEVATRRVGYGVA